MKKIHYLIISLFFLVVSYNIFVKEKIVLGIYGKGIVNLEEKLLIGIPFIFVGLFLLILFFKTKYEKESEYSKCPKCKETFYYNKLEDGMCPECKVKTIDIEKYYDEYLKD